MITEKFTELYESTTDGLCREIRCELVPDTTTMPPDLSSTESWNNFDTKFTDVFGRDEYDATTDATETTTFNDFDNETNSNKSGGNSTEVEESYTVIISNMTEADQLVLRRLCWETMFGQELVKLTVMDLVRVEKKMFH